LTGAGRFTFAAPADQGPRTGGGWEKSCPAS